MTYPLNVGRNFNEIVRTIDALQLVDKYSVATPGNWRDGDDVVIPTSIQDEAVIEQNVPKGFRRELEGRLGFGLESARDFIFTTNGDGYGWTQGSDGALPDLRPGDG